MTTTPIQNAALAEGTWNIDPVHSDVSFTVRHMMVSKVRGRFTKFDGAIKTGAQPSVEVNVDLSSIDTSNEQRDAHIKSADFFEVEQHPTMSYRSTSVQWDGGEELTVDGELTLKGVTRPVRLQAEFNGVTKDPYGGTRAGFSAKTEINRKDFRVDIDMPMDGGGVVIGDKIQINLEVEAVLQA
jgi:polyisoprenoid-binding protein YceI